MNIWSTLGIVASAFLAIWGIVKYVISQQYRLDDNLSKTVINKIRFSSKWKFELNNEFSINKKHPQIYECISNVNGLYFYIKMEERLLTAGWEGKEIISTIYFFRWQRKKIEQFMVKHSSVKESINIMILQPYGSDKLGELDSNEEPEIALDKHLYDDIEKDIEDMLINNRQKSGCLLYGKAGTGKTRLVKYFAQKYKLHIYTIYLNPDYSNKDILMMFNSIPKKCIVLFEDFDSYFDKRECVLKNNSIKFTFDAIINALDGIYNDYHQVLFVMTANDINKIDDSIKHRSSRFKFVREITLPSYERRLHILGKESLAVLTEGMTLDKVFFVQSIKDKYPEAQISDKINLNV